MMAKATNVEASPPLIHIRVVVLGRRQVGKTAITVRYLTKRFIGEYKSFTDLLYRQAVCLDDTWTQVEILDTSTNQKDIRSFPWHHVRWADACVVVYSIESLQSFHEAIDIIEKIKVCKGSSKGRPLMLLANKKDLEHLRQVPARDGELASLHYGCRFSEVSAAEEVWEARTAYEAIIRDAKSWKFNENLPSRPRKLSMMSVSRMLNNMLKKTSFPPLITRKAEVVPVPDPEDRPPHPKALLQHQNQQQRTRKKGLVGHRPMTLTASDPVNELPFHSPS